MLVLDPRGAALVDLPERSLASRRRKHEVGVLLLVILDKSWASGREYWPNGGRFSESISNDVGVGSFLPPALCIWHCSSCLERARCEVAGDRPAIT